MENIDKVNLSYLTPQSDFLKDNQITDLIFLTFLLFFLAIMWVEDSCVVTESVRSTYARRQEPLFNKETVYKSLSLFS